MRDSEIAAILPTRMAQRTLRPTFSGAVTRMSSVRSPACAEEIMAILQTLNGQGRTVIIITHEADIAQFAGRAVAFRDGRIVSDQPVADRRIARRKESAA